MNPKDLLELHYITPLANLPSILERGLLSHRRAAKRPHHSVALADVQDRRASKTVPGGLKLHEYANLYFHARNPMLSRRRAQHRELGVLSVSKRVLERPGVVVTDRNASSDYVRFAAGVEGLSIVDEKLVFAEYWTHDDRIEYLRHKSIKCAEVLVPERIDPTFVRGVYVSCAESEEAVKAVAPTLKTKVSPHLFFL